MFHDLYEFPWQNNKIHKSKFVNLHGFTHPLEACINSYTWYPQYFTNKVKAKMLVDGIIHHMYPFPVRRIDNHNTELNNIKKYDLLPKYFKDIIIESTNRNKFFHICFCRSKYKEGRIVCLMDKKTTMIQDKLSVRGLLAFITGKNKNIIKKQKN